MFELAVLFSFCALLHAVSCILRGHLLAIPLAIISLQMVGAAFAWKADFITTFARTWSRGGQIEFGGANVVYFSAIYLFLLLIYLHRTKGTAYANARLGLAAFNHENHERRMSPVAILLVVFTIYHFYILDFNVVLSNSQYILMSSAMGVAVKTPVNLFIHSVQGLVGLATIVYLSISILSGKKKQAALLVLPALWFLLFNLSAHSRISVVYAAAFAMPLLMSNKKWHKGLASAAIVFAFLNLVNSLNGRGSSVQGLASLFNYFDQSLDFSKLNILDLMGSVLEGVFVQGDGFLYSHHDYPLGYKLSAMSPFPSFIDGYASQYLGFQLRLSRFVPLGATSEVRIFGVPFMVFYFLVVGYSYSSLFSLLKRRNYILFLMAIAIFSLSTYLQFTYPTRNTLRFFYIVILLGIASRFAVSSRASRIGAHDGRVASDPGARSP